MVYSSWDVCLLYVGMVMLLLAAHRERERLLDQIDSFYQAWEVFKTESEKQFQGMERRFVAIEGSMREIIDRFGRVFAEPQALPVPVEKSYFNRWLMAAAVLLMGAGLAYSYALERELRSDWQERAAFLQRKIDTVQGQVMEEVRARGQLYAEMGSLAEIVSSIGVQSCEARPVSSPDLETLPKLALPPNCLCVSDQTNKEAVVWNNVTERTGSMASFRMK